MSVSLPLNLLVEFDSVTQQHGYKRSEAFREGMRLLMAELRQKERLKRLVERR